MNRNNRLENRNNGGNNYTEDTSDYDLDQNQRSFQNQSHSPGSYIWDSHMNMGPNEMNKGWRNSRIQNSDYDRDYRHGNYSPNNVFQHNLRNDSDHFSFRSDPIVGRTGFWGKGPKGYKRSDDRIKEDVCEALYHDNMIDASEIDVAVKEGLVTLSGVTPDRETKRAAERCVENLSGVEDVRNDIRVSRETRTSSNNTDSQKNDEGQIRKMS